MNRLFDAFLPSCCSRRTNQSVLNETQNAIMIPELKPSLTLDIKTTEIRQPTKFGLNHSQPSLSLVNRKS